MPENWKPIRGYGGAYKVSDHGRVMSYMKRTPRLLSERVDKKGYRSVLLYGLDGRRRAYTHRLVAEAFCTRAGGEDQVRHLDDDKANNSAANLAWGTASDNMLDKVRNGRHHAVNKTHCVRGHEFTSENTMWTGPRKSFRQCRECGRERCKRYYSNRKAAA